MGRRLLRRLGSAILARGAGGEQPKALRPEAPPRNPPRNPHRSPVPECRPFSPAAALSIACARNQLRSERTADGTGLPPPDYVTVSRQGRIAVLTLDREEKRNAVCDGLIRDVRAFVDALDPQETSAIVMRGAGNHFCAGLDLAEHKERPPFDGVLHSRFWHETLDLLEFGSVPVVAAMQGGVIGGGLEIATACHVRVSEPSAFYQLPEGRRGIYVGGGASVRVQRIIGFDRMREMMLTGRRYDAETRAAPRSQPLYRTGRDGLRQGDGAGRRHRR